MSAHSFVCKCGTEWSADKTPPTCPACGRSYGPQRDDFGPVVQLPHLSAVELNELRTAVRARKAMMASQADRAATAPLTNFEATYVRERTAILQTLLTAIEEALLEAAHEPEDLSGLALYGHSDGKLHREPERTKSAFDVRLGDHIDCRGAPGTVTAVISDGSMVQLHIRLDSTSLDSLTLRPSDTVELVP